MDPNQNDDQNGQNQGMPADDNGVGGQQPTTPDPAAAPDATPEPTDQPGSAPEVPPPPPAVEDEPDAGQGGGGSQEPGTDTNPAA